ncbi:hypothetical protein [Oleisolibacter albus]|uniref:hypothetical protein n=1 Tax=Oleisolibacter albus TaxID=2171757 RepID=UPI000DF3EE56|nr:hypothetical protein [Oleisolibacter albus]
MPTLRRFSNCSLCLFPQDHNPPHVHLPGPGFTARLGEDDYSVEWAGDMALPCTRLGDRAQQQAA